VLLVFNLMVGETLVTESPQAHSVNSRYFDVLYGKKARAPFPVLAARVELLVLVHTILTLRGWEGVGDVGLAARPTAPPRERRLPTQKGPSVMGCVGVVHWQRHPARQRRCATCTSPHYAERAPDSCI
jgi:hypothetical protein